ncbi:flagellar hook assembly protein FlgD [Aliarcobacter cryaerophilus]|uniref:Basal-body rod modification protein FlgD n=2 Tax=unclassified Arcobacter TaxID=2593671 RepID=A0AA96CQA8_9BACT|nr:flagellar hook capping FlgD N-terminal domain-containing protein [Arcobacter sp. AZ-2023]WPD09290.1 flagellar hook capping FlgD N-terminal domain-containing protein [Arcobacter sp. DSM 115954]WNL14121.1 flagellar hook capping FlgD N-terminal domain-containing protein [Arcobacter sp. AZ-2023]WNL19997.1 flagellar hook capping FlgD N-terminal domain-containing protein [Arcobacter sp. AZ-2023]WNL22138.1 flagellar hook capping FlgD N-terminal domain-containing protein [Arcobacter sp. AZ-2023]
MAEVNSANSVTGTDSYGNKYTQSVSNDSLTTNDFLKLMIEELKLQDPTKPMDSAKMLSTQMQMSTLNANMEMIKALQSIQTAFTQSSLSTATGVIGKNIENGSTNKDGALKAFTVESIENVDGEIQVVAREWLYLHNGISLKDGDELKAANYDETGNLFDEKGEKTGQTIVLESLGKPLVKDGKLVVKDADGNEVSDHKYVASGKSTVVVSDEIVSMPFSSITKIF